MLRKLGGTCAVAIVLCLGAVMADEIKGTITKVDVDGKKITVKVDGKEKVWDVADDAKLPGRNNKGTLKTLSKAVDRAKSADKDYKAIITTDKENKKVVQIKRDNSRTPKKPPQ